MWLNIIFVILGLILGSIALLSAAISYNALARERKMILKYGAGTASEQEMGKWRNLLLWGGLFTLGCSALIIYGVVRLIRS